MQRRTPGGAPRGPRQAALRDEFPVLAMAAAPATPGRLVAPDAPPVIPPKPGPDETPFRSRFYVARRESADGNGYRRGDPIPLAEEERQLERIGGGAPLVRIPRKTCPSCRGSKIQGHRRRPGHKPDCGCVSCAPCRTCHGSGYVVI